MKRRPLPQPELSLGQLVIARRLATPEKVDAVLGLQKRKAAAGEFVPLGQLLVDEGLLSSEQVRDLLAEQSKSILACPRCRTQVTVDGSSTGRMERSSGGTPRLGDPVCPRCGTALVEPDRLDRLTVEEAISTKAERPTTEPGRHLLGRYEILGEISRGGMGIVYKARDPKTQATVALKVMQAGNTAHAMEDLIRFEREAQAVSRLRHPNIVAIHDVGNANGVHFYAMSYVAGIPLSKLLKEREPPPPEALLGHVEKIARAVEYAHGRGVVHRDLKPSNILVDGEGEPHLIDFGIAKFAGDRDLTRSGTFLGSAAYMAPEYIEGEAPRFDLQADVYALGICLYECLTGRTPFADDDTIRMLKRVLESEAPEVGRHAREGVPIGADLATIVMTAIDRDPSWRYQTAGALAEDLERLRRAEPIRARPRSAWRLFRQRARRHAGSIVVVLAALAVAGGAWWHARSRVAAVEGTIEDEVRDRTRAAADGLVVDGRAHLSERRLDDARASFTAALALVPDHADALFGRAVALERSGEAEAAAADRRRAVALDDQVAARFEDPPR